MATTEPGSAAVASADSKAQVNGIMQQDAAKGRVAVHSFDPDASPSEKAASASKGRDQLKSVSDSKGPSAQELPIDTGHSKIVPTITVSDADDGTSNGSTKPGQNGHDSEPGVPTPPGALPAGAAPVIPDWYKIGWRAASGIDHPPLPDGEEKDKTVLDAFIAEQFYGTWYHNAAIIIFAVFATHFLTRFRFGWGWLLIILAVCATYYSTSMARVRRRARDDIQRELTKTRMASEHETADWINNFLDRFWLIYEPVLSGTIVASVEQILSTSTPAFLESMHLTDFTLGTKAPRIDRVRTFPGTAEDVVLMDWALSFTPNDVSDITPKQAAKKVNPKIVLSIRVGKGLASAAMPILLEDINFSGLMRIRLQLMTNFPHVQIVDISFLEKPVIDYVLKPIGGETFGFDIASIPGLSSFIRDMTHATLGPMMYDPNKFTLNLEQIMSGAPLDTAIGVLQVTLHNARSLKGTKMGGGSPDPFVTLSIANREELARTKYKHNTYNPTWNETKFLLINTLADPLALSVFDYNDHRKDTLLGSVSYELSKLGEDAKQENISKTILKDGKERGDLRFDLSFYPVLKPQIVDGQEQLPESNVGIVRFTIHQAKDLDHTKSTGGDLNPIAKIFTGETLIHTTKKVKHTTNPVWEAYQEFLCADRASSIITVKIIDDRDILKDPVIGYASFKLEDLLEAKKDAGKDWWPLSHCKSGKVRLSVDWKPLNMAGSLESANQYVPPIGVVRLWLNKATDVKNVEATLGGKSDPYMRVLVNNVIKGRTEVINNNLSPVWDQIVYIPVHSLKEHILLECMDYQHLTKDRSLGSVELLVSELAKPSNDKSYPFESTGLKSAAEKIKLEKGSGYKGELYFDAQFVPALALRGVKFEAQPSELERAAESAGGEDDGDVALDDKERAKQEKPEVPEMVTATRPIDGDVTPPKEKPPSAHANEKSTDSGHTDETATEKEAEVPGVDMSTEELLKQQSGIIVLKVISGKLAKKARLEVLLDDGYWPAFSTVKARSTTVEWDHVGEGFIKELDFGRVWLRLNEDADGEKDEIIAEWKGDAKAFLEATMKGPTKYTLVDEEERSSSVVEIEGRYVPVPVKLDARESINNQGVLRVDLLDGRDILGVDRGGKSDPFAVFQLNGQKVFKSQTKKKTLTPEWNENFTISVPSRVAADFEVEIFDWNQLEQSKSLGTAKIPLADIEPFQAAERVLNLVSPKGKGAIRVRLLFQPEIIAKSRKNTSTFSAAGRAMTQIGGLPFGATKGVVHGVSHGVSGVLGKGFGGKAGKEKEEAALPEIPAGQSSQPVGQSDTMVANASAMPAVNSKGSLEGNGVASNEPGTLKVTVLDAKDLGSGDIKPYVTIRVGEKEHKTKHASKTATPEWNESFTFTASGLTPKLYAWIHDHKTLGKDKQLGEAEIDIWRHIQAGAKSSADVFAELREGSGLLRLRLEFDVDSNANTGNSNLLGHGSSVSVDRTGTMVSPASRFSLRSRRPPTESTE